MTSAGDNTYLRRSYIFCNTSRISTIVLNYVIYVKRTFPGWRHKLAQHQCKKWRQKHTYWWRIMSAVPVKTYNCNSV